MRAGTIISGFTTQQIGIRHAQAILNDIVENNDLTKANIVVKLDVKVKSK